MSMYYVIKDKNVHRTNHVDEPASLPVVNTSVSVCSSVKARISNVEEINSLTWRDPSNARKNFLAVAYIAILSLFRFQYYLIVRILVILELFKE